MCFKILIPSTGSPLWTRFDSFLLADILHSLPADSRDAKRTKLADDLAVAEAGFFRDTTHKLAQHLALSVGPAFLGLDFLRFTAPAVEGAWRDNGDQLADGRSDRDAKLQ